MLHTSKNTTKKNGLLIGLVAGCGVIIVLLSAVVVLLLGQGQGGSNAEEPRRNVVVNEENVEKALKELDKKEFVPAGRYEAKMNSVWYFDDGSSPSRNAYVENVLGNTNDVYFDLILADTEEVILASPIIPRGSYMKEITLDKDLEPGTYECVMVYHLVDEDQNTLSTVRMAVTVIIEG